MVGQNGVIQGSRKPKKEKGHDCNKITAAKLQKLIKQQQYCCALTGRNLVPSAASVDHIVPLADGGENSIDNIQVVHSDVNQAKGTMSQREFIEMCREVVMHTEYFE